VTQNLKSVGEIDEAILNNPALVVLFTAPSWCVPCRALKPHFAAAADKVDVPVFIVDLDEADNDVSEAFAVMGVPTIAAFKNGIRVNNINSRNAPGLIKEINDL
jgi:thiol-disulfide isomerase/thioredoxin